MSKADIYDKFQVKHVILSRGRWDTIVTHKLIAATVLCPASEYDNYRKHLGEFQEIDLIPDEVEGLGAVRNWCLKTYEDSILMMYDDDITGLAYVGYETCHRIFNRDKVKQIMENTALCALDTGAELFSVAPFGLDVRKYWADRPFGTHTSVSGIVGIIGRNFWFDEKNKLKVDTDFTLQHLLHKRIMWMDFRYSFTQIRNINKGGNAKYRSTEAIQREKDYLKKKWGRYITLGGKYKDSERTGLNVKRTQYLIL